LAFPALRQPVAAVTTVRLVPQRAGSPLRGRDQGGRATITVVVIIAFLAVAIYGGWAIWSVQRAEQAVNSGIEEARSAREVADAADLTDERPVGHVRQARAHFDRGARITGQGGLAPARLMPVVGRQLRSVHALSTAAVQVADVALDLHATFVDELESGDRGGLQRIALLESLRVEATAADERLAAIDLGPREGLLRRLAEGREELAEVIFDTRTGLRRGAAAAGAAADVLGGPRRYLVLAGNNAEMRAGFGMFLSVGVIETVDGSLRIAEPMRPSGDLTLPPGIVEVSGDLEGRWGWLRPGEDWRDLMASPRFPASAELATRMWEATGGPPVDGVLALDPVALRAILAATGPIEVDDRRIGADDVVDELLRRQYERFADDPDSGERREQLGGIVSAALESFEEGDWDTTAMIRELASAARGRHLLAWSSDPAVADAFASAGIDGRLESDSMMVSILNRGGNKLDRWLQVEAELGVDPGEDGAEGFVRIQVRNVAPEGLPPYVAGPHPLMEVEPGDYVGVVALTVPGSSVDGRFDGGRPLVAVGPDGPAKVLATEISLARGEQVDLVARFRLVGDIRELRVEPSARVPPVTWRYRGDRWEDRHTRQVRW
jgi:hypothetical protein